MRLNRLRKMVTLSIMASVLLCAPTQALESVVKRTTLLVSNIEQSMAFYEAIGFSVWLDRGGDRNPEGGDLPLNAKPTQSRIAIMQGQHEDWAMIGLLQYDNPPLPWTRDPDNPTIGTSDAVLVIVTDDIAQAYKNLLAINATILKPPRAYTSNSVKGRKEGAIMFFQDPDGNVIEMTEVYSLTPYGE
ncbi:MAG: VOC family protein [Rhodospirillaceae bacterium]